MQTSKDEKINNQSFTVVFRLALTIRISCSNNNNNNNNNNNKMILIEYQLHFQSVPRNIAWGSISADRAFNVSTMAEDNISVQI